MDFSVQKGFLPFFTIAVVLLCACAAVSQLMASEQYEQRDIPEELFALDKRGALCEGIQLKAEVKSSIINQGDRVTIRLRCHNISGIAQPSFKMADNYLGFFALVIGPNGRIYTQKKTEPLNFISGSRFDFKPGDEILYAYSLTDQYGNFEPGIYQITFLRYVRSSKQNNYNHVLSNTVALTVLDKTPKAQDNNRQASENSNKRMADADTKLNNALEKTQREKDLNSLHLVVEIDPSSTIVQGKPVGIKFQIINAGERILWIGLSTPEKDFDLLIKGPKGELNPLQDIKHTSTIGWDGSSFPLQPHEQLNQKMMLSGYYDLSTPGTYQITASIPMGKLNEKNYYLISNTATLTILDMPSDVSLSEIFVPKKQGAVTEGYKLDVEFDQTQISSGKPVLLKHTVLNLTDKVRSIFEGAPGNTYKVFIRGPSGVLTPRKPAGHFAFESFKNREIPPCVAIQQKYLLSDEYDFSAVGEYVISLALSVRSLNGMSYDYVVSNPVRLTVIKSKK
ncbi:MAG: hypothetical protein WCO51_00710 [bacterium]